MRSSLFRIDAPCSPPSQSQENVSISFNGGKDCEHAFIMVSALVAGVSFSWGFYPVRRWVLTVGTRSPEGGRTCCDCFPSPHAIAGLSFSSAPPLSAPIAECEDPSHRHTYLISRAKSSLAESRSTKGPRIKVQNH